MTVTCSPCHATTGHGGCICSAVFGRGGGEAVGAHDPTLTPAAARWHGLRTASCRQDHPRHRAMHLRSAMSRRVRVPRPGSRRIARRERPLAQLVDADRVGLLAFRPRPGGYRFVALRLGGRSVIHGREDPLKLPRIPSGTRQMALAAVVELALSETDSHREPGCRSPGSGQLDADGRVASSRAKELDSHSLIMLQRTMRMGD